MKSENKLLAAVLEYLIQRDHLSIEPCGDGFKLVRVCPGECANIDKCKHFRQSVWCWRCDDWEWRGHHE